MTAEHEADAIFKRPKLVEKVRECGLLEELVGSQGDNDLGSKENIRFGRRIKKVWPRAGR